MSTDHANIIYLIYKDKTQTRIFITTIHIFTFLYFSPFSKFVEN